MTDKELKAPEFTWSDAWLLHAVAVAGGDGPGASLTDILATGDGLNHAVFTSAELRRGFGKLSFAGLVAEREMLFVLEGLAANVWRGTLRHQSLASQRIGLERLLDVAPHPAGDPGFEDLAWRYPSLTDARIKVAEDEYRKRSRSSR